MVTQRCSPAEYVPRHVYNGLMPLEVRRYDDPQAALDAAGPFLARDPILNNLYYAALCAAVPVLRRRQPGAAHFRIPLGPLLPWLGVLLCVVLGTRADLGDSVILVSTVAIAFMNWLVIRRRGSSEAPAAEDARGGAAAGLLRAPAASNPAASAGKSRVD